MYKDNDKKFWIKILPKYLNWILIKEKNVLFR